MSNFSKDNRPGGTYVMGGKEVSRVGYGTMQLPKLKDCTSLVFTRHPGRRGDAQAAVGSGSLTSSVGTISGISVMPSASINA